MDWKCVRCGYQATTKGNILRHIKKKRPCEPTLSPTPIQVCIDRLLEKRVYVCHGCKKNYKSLIYYNKHLAKCRDIIVDFGKESISHLSHEFMNTCVMRLGFGLSMLFEALHFNDKAPRNKNIMLVSDKRGYVQVFMEGRWKTIDRNALLDLVIRNLCRLLQEHRNQHELHDEHITMYIASVLNKESNYYEVRRMLSAVLLDNIYKTDELTLIPQKSAGCLE
jgi:hypothetical protein